MFIKYQHVERLGSDEVEGITVGECHIFPKIDGTNASVWMEGEIDWELCTGSRNRLLSLGDDNAGFCQYITQSDIDDRIIELLTSDLKPWMTLYGEWLVPHSLKTYREDAWRKFYIFDVYDREKEEFVSYAEYAPALERHNLDFIPLIETVTNPSPDHLHKVLMQNTYLIKDGEGAGEGIVIKRYDFKSRYGRTTWAKLVRNEFKEENKRVFGVPVVSMSPIEHKIAAAFITQGRIDKIVAKMKTEKDVPLRTRVPELFGRVWHELIADEMWNILKKHKQPTINFKLLYRHTVEQVKACVPEVFG